MSQNPVWSSTLDDLDGVKAIPMQYYIWDGAVQLVLCVLLEFGLQFTHAIVSLKVNKESSVDTESVSIYSS